MNEAWEGGGGGELHHVTFWGLKEAAIKIRYTCLETSAPTCTWCAFARRSNTIDNILPPPFYGKTCAGCATDG